MITRIVKMKLKTGHSGLFKDIFYESQELIRTFDGCMGVELMVDHSDPDEYFTISRWLSQEHLDSYRESVLFKTTWSKVKPLFSVKAEAWSLVHDLKYDL